MAIPKYGEDVRPVEVGPTGPEPKLVDSGMALGPRPDSARPALTILLEKEDVFRIVQRFVHEELALPGRVRFVGPFTMMDGQMRLTVRLE